MDITKKDGYAVINADYSVLSADWTTRKSAIGAALGHGLRHHGVRVIQGGYDENGDGYFREVYPRIMRTWEPRRPAPATVSA